MEADDRRVASFHSPTVIPPSALDKPSIMKRYHRRRTFSHTSPRRSPTMVRLHDTRFVECRWWNDGWIVKPVVAWRSSASRTPAPGCGDYNGRCVRDDCMNILFASRLPYEWRDVRRRPLHRSVFSVSQRAQRDYKRQRHTSVVWQTVDTQTDRSTATLASAMCVYVQFV